jgi:hypothetical protein
MTKLWQLIQPEEYDQAVMREPGSCVLLAAGDLRSGRQLLEDFEADQKLKIQRINSVSEHVVFGMLRICLCSPLFKD